MDIYNLIKQFNKIKSARLKLFAIFIMYIAKRRFLSLYVDPVVACNLKCKMCYFSSEQNHIEKGRLDLNEFSLFAKSILHRVMKVQIGCGAEPTLYSHLVELVKISKSMNVPYVSLTTNGNILKAETLHSMVKSGLNEITISSHGIKRETYENLMQKASYDLFLNLLSVLRDIKRVFPNFIIRLNYTVNEDNVEELVDLPKLFKGLNLNIIQIRPVQDLGDSLYKNFSMKKILENYDSIFPMLQSYCEDNNIKFLYPSKDNLININKKSNNNAFLDFVHVYVRPSLFWREDYDYHNKSFEQYSYHVNFGLSILKNIIYINNSHKNYITNPLNYHVK